MVSKKKKMFFSFLCLGKTDMVLGKWLFSIGMGAKFGPQRWAENPLNNVAVCQKKNQNSLGISLHCPHIKSLRS